MSHLAESSDQEFIQLERLFSSFQFVENRFLSSPPIQKLFSLSRSRRGQTLVLEKVEPTVLIQEENENLAKLDSDYRPSPLIRLSFWKDTVTKPGQLKASNCLGYSLLKHDALPNENADRWHVYEAVFQPLSSRAQLTLHDKI